MADPNERLLTAAVKLSMILSNNGTKHGIFGGWAINALGGDRATKDIDCLAAIGKEDLIELMARQPGWTRIPNMREDYAAFFWDDHLKRPVLVEVFIGSTNSPANTENASRAMQAIHTQTMQMKGSPVSPPDVVYIFKGKLHAAADRQKMTDAADLTYLARFHKHRLQAHAHLFSLKDVGKAVDRYPELAGVLSELQIDVKQAMEQTSPGGDMQMSPPAFDVQRGIIE